MIPTDDAQPNAFTSKPRASGDDPVRKYPTVAELA